MLKDDLLTALILAYLTAGFLLPTIIGNRIWDKFPHTYILVFLFAIFPILALVGITIAHTIGKKIHILWQFAKFAMVGVSNVAIDFGILNTLALLTHIDKGPAILFINATAFSTAVVNSYYWNRNWTFRGAKQADFISFFAVSLIGLAINDSIVFTVTTFVKPHLVQTGQQWLNVAKVMATAISLFWNFTGYKVIVFRK